MASRIEDFVDSIEYQGEVEDWEKVTDSDELDDEDEETEVEENLSESIQKILKSA